MGEVGSIQIKLMKGNDVIKQEQPLYQDFDSVSRKANKIISDTKDVLSLLPLHRFDSNLSSSDPSTCYNALVSHRLVNKFSASEVSTSLRDVAFTNYRNYDENQCRKVSEFQIFGPTSEHLHLRQAKALLSKWFKTFELDLYDARVEFTPGETYTPLKGNVSVGAKLSEREHWTVSYNCLEDACLLIYHNAGLKRAARWLIGHVNKSDRRQLYDEHRYAGALTGYRVFRDLLCTRVLTVVNGARGSSVPKNVDTDRFINVEPLFNVILQRITAAAIRKILARHGNDLDNQVSTVVGNLTHDGTSAQELHKFLIKFPEFATIDFSNASDSVTIHVIQLLFPTTIRNALLTHRSAYVLLGDDEYEPYKLSSMGNGFTFEVMTVMLYALASTYSAHARVYGDDVIIPNDVASSFSKACALIGFSVNGKKTFIDSLFRESCGAFYHDAYGYLESFDFTRIETPLDLIVTCNKLHILINGRCSDLLLQDVKDALIKAHTDLLMLVPVLQKGAVPPAGVQLKYLASFVFDDKVLSKHKRSALCRQLLAQYVDVHSASMTGELERATIVVVPFFKNKRYKVKGKMNFLLAVLQGRRTEQKYRNQGYWSTRVALVLESGIIYSCDGDLGEDLFLHSSSWNGLK